MVDALLEFSRNAMQRADWPEQCIQISRAKAHLPLPAAVAAAPFDATPTALASLLLFAPSTSTDSESELLFALCHLLDFLSPLLFFFFTGSVAFIFIVARDANNEA